ncbi:16S rRNA (guanine(966)-N(2))-methyltransferase RsmD [Rheinheimera sp.]|uniref:16S rRNA (guanine(966)-N(2))-methyltransferase RsmD n=1 Tax=Rheinheimera sp. TaxID=1869214 RepID=UPI00307E00AC
MKTTRQKNSPSHQGPGYVRLISGRWKGRRLPVLDAQGLRPTSDRVKETLFNWLMQDVAGAVVLDCFAGSGSLGLEALSRYAASVLLLEKDAQTAALLKKHLQSLNSSEGAVHHTDTLLWLQKPATTQFDLVFIDPPFRQQLALPTCQALASQGWLKPGALVYLETEKELTLQDIPAGWTLLKEKIAGQLAYRLWQAAE